MAIASNGPNGNHVGRIGNIVYYVLNGKNVSRNIGENNTPPTSGQLKTRYQTKICSELFGKMQDFLRVGFSIEQLGTTKNAFNLAVQHNKHRMFKGVYPDLQIAYDMLTLSKGILAPAKNPKLKKTVAGIKFSWEVDPKITFPAATDQVMMIAYFPEEELTVCTLFGNQRAMGSAVLLIPESLKEKHAETYISFISADRKQVADSIYTGSLNK